ncbi:glycosyltransferase family 1 protein [Crucibulum laeve]|uniref:UDP-N-acetylglucosamine transferase subunit ALG14 n=1 Tax=Crucibulum laeve TaxID=68775 RepID=A0A5C3MJ80_9AGAR|nr:glycosyltransferase family 1 protein [Crucibulum laeve]
MIATFTVVVFLLAAFRLYIILPLSRTLKPRTASHSISTRRLAIFLGSGGHTAEALALLSTLDFSRYTPRTYIISEGDILSSQKAVALEASRAISHPKSNNDNFTILIIPRARGVHQSILTTPPTALLSLLTCIYYVTVAPILYSNESNSDFADLLILNGPGTCFVLCLAVYINKFAGLRTPSLIYIESFARVKKLSLSGRLLRPLVDKFIVQWPQLLQDRGRGECHGLLV